MLKNVSSKVIFQFIGIAALAFYFGLSAYLATYSRFIADDYCSAYDASRLGLARFVWYWFITWGGRLSAVASDIALVWLGQTKIGLAPGIAIALWVAINTLGIYWMDGSAEKKATRSVNALFFGLLLVYFFFQTLPNIPQTFFWYSAFRTHSLAVILFNLFWVVYLRSTKFNGKPALWLMGGFFYGWINGGFSEAFTAMQIGTLLLFLLAIGWNRRNGWDSPSVMWVLGGVFGAILAMAIMFLSPGTQNRQEFFDAPRTLQGIVTISWEGFLVFFRSVFKDPFRGFGVAASLLFAFILGAGSEAKSKLPVWGIAVLGLGGVCAVFASMVPAAYGMGDFLPRRAFPIPIFFGLLPAIIAAYLLGPHLSQRFTANRKAMVTSIALGFLLVSLAGNVNTLFSYQMAMKKYAENIDSLQVQVQAAIADGETELQIGSLGNWAGVYDPNDNPKYWVTACFSKYYGIQILGPKITQND